MDYKKQIIEMLDKIEDSNILKYFYLFIKGKVKAEDWISAFYTFFS